jgi:hypothetical protein
MSDPCWSCRQRPPVLPDGRCETCGNAQPESLPTQIAPSPPAGPPGPHPPTEIGAPPQPPTAVGPPPPGAFPQQPPPQQPYPQYPAYPGGGSNAMVPAQFSSPRGLATALTALLGVCIGLWALGVIADTRMMSVLTGIEDGDFSAFEDYDDANDFYTGVGVLQLLGILGTGIVFIIWFHRSRVNAELFEPSGQRMGRGWAIGAWFTPVVNFWFPKQIANDIWRSSTPWGAAPGRGLLNAWWVLWIINLVTSLLAGAFNTGDEILDTQEELDEAQRQVSMTTLNDLVGIATAILALLVVRKLTQRQLVKYQQGPQGPQGMPSAPPPYGMPGAPGMPPYGG